MKRSEIIKSLKEFNYNIDFKDSTRHLWSILCIYRKNEHCFCHSGHCYKQFGEEINCKKYRKS